MTAKQNVAILSDAYQRWHDTKGGSIDHWMSLMEDEIQFMSLAQGAVGAEFTAAATSRSQVGGYFAGLTTQWEMIHFTVDEFIAENDRVVMLGSTAWTNKSTGKTVETPKADVLRMKNGKIVEFAEFYDTAGMIAGCVG